MKEHEEPLGESASCRISTTSRSTTSRGRLLKKLHDGSKLYLKKVSEDYNPTDKHAALRLLQETDKRGEFATGILYVAPDKQDLVDLLNIVDEPLATLPLERVRPSRRALDEFMEAHRQTTPAITQDLPQPGLFLALWQCWQ